MVGDTARIIGCNPYSKRADNDPDMGETADMRSTTLNWAMNQDNTYEKISDCFEGSFTVCGQNLLSIWMDFREDPENGKILAVTDSHFPHTSLIPTGLKKISAIAAGYGRVNILRDSK